MTARRLPLVLTLGAAALLVGGIALGLALPQRDVLGLVDLRGGDLPAGPELHLVSPADGEGVPARVTVVGTATSSARDVLDVQYRLDGERWRSAPVPARGQRSLPFEVPVDIPAGTHLLEFRAYDGEVLSLPASVLLRRDAPTVRIVQPADGAGVPTGLVTVAGTARGDADDVLLEVDGLRAGTAKVIGGSWNATILLAEGEHVLRATARGARASLPHAIRLAADAEPPPTVAIALPRAGASYGESGDDLCLGGCILVAGSAAGAERVELELDGRPLPDATLVGGAWTSSIPTATLANGTHELSARPVRADGLHGVERTARFLARTPVTLDVEGTFEAQPTGTPLSFLAFGSGAEAATWTLDGQTVGAGPAVEIALAEPGDHLLTVAGGGARNATTRSIPLHALNRAPSVDFLGAPAQLEGQHVFDAEATDPDGRIVGFRWDFGDGATTTTATPNATHRYTERGDRVARLTAIDELGAETSTEISFTVANGAPAANFTWEPSEPSIFDTVALVDTSLDHDGLLVERAWRLPDGTWTADESPTLRFRERGAHTVTLRVLDDLGALGELSQRIVVRNLAPDVAFRHEPEVARTHEEIAFTDASVDADGPIRSWTWDFGDDATASGPTALHVFRAPGVHPVTLRVVDDAGAAIELVRNVTVADTPPEVLDVTVLPAEPTAQQEARFLLQAGDRDGAIVAARWDFGDGTNSTDTEPIHRYARSGLYTARVTVYDQGALEANLSFLVRVLNAPPTSTLKVGPGAIAAFPTFLHANATDPDGRIVYYRFDADGDGLHDCEGVEPVCGHVYEQAGAFAASVTVEDDEGGVGEAHVLVDIVPPPPDTPPPTLSIEAPASHARLKGDHLLRGTARGPREIVKVDLQMRTLDFAFSGTREPWRLATGAEEWHALLDTTLFADGDYQLVVRAIDSAGGVGYARVPITVQNGPRPSEVTVLLLDPPAVLVRDATLRGSAFHPEGVTAVRWRIDHGDWIQEGENPLAFTIDLDHDRLKPGEHVLRVEAYHGVTDSASATHVFHVPGVAPQLVIDLPPNAAAHGLILASGRIIGEGHAQWRLDRGLWEDIPGTKEWNLTLETLRYRGGNHTLGLRAVSPDGRLTSPISNHTVYIINPPLTQSDGQPARTAPPADRADRADVPALPMALGVAAGLAAALRRRHPG